MMMGGWKVDKREKGQTITIKINGKDRPFKEGHSEDAETNRKTGNNIRLDKDKYAVRNETAAAEEPLEESFDWILPELSDEPNVIKITDQAKRIRAKVGAESQIEKTKNLEVFSPLSFFCFSCNPIRC